jgi:hypothetical protein
VKRRFLTGESPSLFREYSDSCSTIGAASQLRRRLDRAPRLGPRAAEALFGLLDAGSPGYGLSVPMDYALAREASGAAWWWRRAVHAAARRVVVIVVTGVARAL